MYILSVGLNYFAQICMRCLLFMVVGCLFFKSVINNLMSPQAYVKHVPTSYKNGTEIMSHNILDKVRLSVNSKSEIAAPFTVKQFNIIDIEQT